MKQTYVYDNASGNLLSRDYRISGAPGGLTESFSYDNLNRLTGSQVTGAGLMSVTYSPDGNINTKTDAGSYTYDPSKQNAITAMTRYYSGSYEKTITGSTVTETHYVSSPTGLVAILVKQGSAVQTYYVETDHLGSVTGIINTDKTYASKSSYDAWGRRRNPADWSYNNIPTPVITDRGFTGHEHLDRFGLINMNGRMYDPVVGRFLGVDPVVQAPDYSQSFNGYSYCWNNPLKYTDPSGYELDALTTSDIVNNLWNSGGGYWSSLFPDYFIPYFHDYDPHENSLLEYSIFQFLTTLQGSRPGGRDGEGLVEYDKNRGEYGYYIKEKPDLPPGICLRFISIHSLNGGGPNYIDRVGFLDGAGYVTDAAEYAAKLTSKETFIYGQRVNGVVKSAAQLTSESAAIYSKLASKLNVLGATIGTVDCTVQGVSDYKNGNTGLAAFEFSKAAVYAAGIILIAVSPFTAGSTAVVGGYVIAGTSIVDIAGDIGLYIYGRNR